MADTMNAWEQPKWKELDTTRQVQARRERYAHATEAKTKWINPQKVGANFALSPTFAERVLSCARESDFQHNIGWESIDAKYCKALVSLHMYTSG